MPLRLLSDFSAELKEESTVFLMNIQPSYKDCYLVVGLKVSDWRAGHFHEVAISILFGCRAIRNGRSFICHIPSAVLTNPRFGR